MAAPATHIVLANKVYEKHFSDKDYGKFIVGTSFPDIRYTGVIDRSATHSDDLRLIEVQSKDSFESGLLFHSLVDEVREKYMKEKGLYDLFPESQFKTQGVKFFEDMVLYDKIADWPKQLVSFKNILDEELRFGISEEAIEKWHRLLVQILSSKLTDADVRLFVAEIGKPEVMAEEIIRVVHNPKDDRKTKEIILGFYDDFESLIDA
jgi:hypothetical protein